MRPVAIAALALLATSGCGARTPLAGSGQADATSPTIEAGTVAGEDSGADTATDAWVEGAEAAAEAGDDAGEASDTGCPSSYGAANGSCSTHGAICQYPEGTCTCHGECACGCCPTTCAAQGIQCGLAGDGCGGLLHCGGCPPTQLCGGGGTPGQCGGDSGPPDACIPMTCAEAGALCGIALDGCGGQIDCGPCLTWGCTPTQKGCPSIQPTAGIPCAPDGVACLYNEWTQGCCMQTMTCQAGVWSAGQLICPL